MTPGETVVLLLLAVLFLAVVGSTMVLVFFRPWLILRGERDQHQEELESTAADPRESSETATEASDKDERTPEENRPW